MKVKVKDLKPGMRVDLQGDKYADPKNDNVGYEHEYVVVERVEQETPECIVLHPEEGSSIGFPNDHEVTVDGEAA